MAVGAGGDGLMQDWLRTGWGLLVGLWLVRYWAAPGSTQHQPSINTGSTRDQHGQLWAVTGYPGLC